MSGMSRALHGLISPRFLDTRLQQALARADQRHDAAQRTRLERADCYKNEAGLWAGEGIFQQPAVFTAAAVTSMVGLTYLAVEHVVEHGGHPLLIVGGMLLGMATPILLDLGETGCKQAYARIQLGRECNRALGS